MSFDSFESRLYMPGKGQPGLGIVSLQVHALSLEASGSGYRSVGAMHNTAVFLSERDQIDPAAALPLVKTGSHQHHIC